jgi:NTP pyrophosphatase (non-canonical NTP hydrolase)
MASDLDPLLTALRGFAADRKWAPFHAPKNLACALSVEAAELLAHFQWLTEAQSRSLSDAQRDAVALEMADVFLYLLQLADGLQVDLVATAHRKIALNAIKHPVPTAE